MKNSGITLDDGGSIPGQVEQTMDLTTAQDELAALETSAAVQAIGNTPLLRLTRLRVISAARLHRTPSQTEW